MIELKKCPFCGGTAHSVLALNDKICIVCMKCGIGTQPERDYDVAARAWNRRVKRFWGDAR